MPKSLEELKKRAKITASTRASTAEIDPVLAVKNATSTDEVIEIIKKCPFDVTKDVTIRGLTRELAFEEAYANAVAKDKGDSLKSANTHGLWPCLGSTRKEAAYKLMPHISDRADYLIAMSPGDTKQKSARLHGENTEVNIGTEDCPVVVHAFDNCKPPTQPYSLLKAIALCEGPDHIKRLKEINDEESGEPDLLEYGDLAIPPAFIGAPMRKGKTKASFVLLWFDLRCGFRCTYGLAPNKNNVIKPVWEKLIGMKWHDPRFGLLKSPAATYVMDPTTFELRSTARKIESITSDTESNLLFYSIDSANDVACAKAFIDMSKPKVVLTRPYAGCPNYDADDPTNAASAEIFYEHHYQRPCSNIRDEAHNAAKTGAEEQREKLQKKQEELENATNKLANASTPEEILKARARKEAATKGVATAEKKYAAAAYGIMSGMRATFPNSNGYSTNMTATVISTFQEQPMYGTHIRPEGPMGLKLFLSDDPEERKGGIEQCEYVLPALRPNSDTFYKGTNNTVKVDYNTSRGYTKETVYAKYLELVHAYNTGYGNGSTTKALSISQPEFNNGSFSHVHLLRPNGSKEPKKAVSALTDTAKMDVYVDAVVIGPPVVSRVIPSIDHSPDYAQQAILSGEQQPPSILPTTIISVTDKVVKSKSPYNSSSLEVSKRLVDLLIKKKQAGVVAVWGTGLKESEVQKVFPEASFTAGFKMNTMKSVLVLHVQKWSASSPSRLSVIENHCADFDEVARNISNRVDMEELHNTCIFCVGYHMFTGAITLTTTIEATKMGEDGILEPDLIICPQHIVYKHTKYRQLDNMCQQVGRAFNDFKFPASQFKILLLAEQNVLAQCKDYMGGEATLLNEMEKPVMNSGMKDGSVSTWRCTLNELDGSTPLGFFVRATYVDCMVGVSAFYEQSKTWKAGSLAEAPIGLKAGKMKAKFTLQTTVADKYDASEFVGEFEAMSDDDEVDENMLAIEDNRFKKLPDEYLIHGVPYLVCCAIVWFTEKLNGAKLTPANKVEYARKFKEVVISPQGLGTDLNSGWVTLMPDTAPKTAAEKDEFAATVVLPFLHEHHPGSQARNYLAPFWQFYKFFTGPRVSAATPEDFGYASPDAAAAAAADDEDPEWTPTP